MGARAVQFDAIGELSPDNLSQTGRRQLRHMVVSHGMTIAAVGFPTRRGYDNLERLEARVQQTHKVLQFAYEMGAPLVVNHIGVIPESREPKHIHFFDSMESIGRQADRVGARFGIETGENSPQRLAEFLKETNLFGLAVNFDPANLFARGHDIYDAVGQLYQWIAGVHVKDVVRSGGISGVTEVPVGKGDLDWEVILGRLLETEYTGSLIVERETTDDPVNDLRSAIEYLQRLQNQ